MSRFLDRFREFLDDFGTDDPIALLIFLLLVFTYMALYGINAAWLKIRRRRHKHEART